MLPDLTIDCPAFDYTTVPGFNSLLRLRTNATLLAIARTSPARLLDHIKDTRPVHGQYFRDLTPPGTPYYAGNYRGQDFLCLRHYEVNVDGDPRVGHPPHLVGPHMAGLAAAMDDAILQCDVMWRVPNTLLSPTEKLARIVAVATAVFVYFLEIHPYANGNGHAGRFILIAALARHGLFVRRWQMHPRPADPPYTDAITAYRNGNRGILERFVLSCL